jgi:uncharacterized protein YjbJ (UPF0337 family)
MTDSDRIKGKWHQLRVKLSADGERSPMMTEGDIEKLVGKIQERTSVLGNDARPLKNGSIHNLGKVLRA